MQRLGRICRSVAASAAIVTSALLAAAATAEPVAVRHTEGSLRGFLVLRSLDDKILADGELTQTVKGDRVTARDIQHFQSTFQDYCTLVNGLGATECRLVRQFFVDMQTRIAPGDVVPIGYAVPDVTVSIVDGDNQPAPVGSAGEIIVTSRYLATGYWKNLDLTAQRFEPAANGVRHYRTGDLGQLQEDGCLIHLGRVDRQVRTLLRNEATEPHQVGSAGAGRPGLQVHPVVDHGRGCPERMTPRRGGVTAHRDEGGGVGGADDEIAFDVA